MNKIDTSSWVPFSMQALFGHAKLGKYHNPADLTEDTNGFPFICASNSNNGIHNTMPRVTGNDLALTPPHIISWGKQCLKFCYHDEPSVTLQGMYYYDVGDTPKEACLYICSVLQGIIGSSKFGYNDCLIGSTVDKMTVLLPALTIEEPDWNYMESYMKSIMDGCQKRLQSLLKSSSRGKSVDVSGWKEFRVGDLFEKLDLRCHKKFDKATDISTEQTDKFDLPLVNAKHGNNGIMYYGRSEDWDSAEMTIDIVSNGAASTGDVYAQPQRTGVLFDAYLVKPAWDCTSEHILQYMACVIERCVKSHFGYDNKCTWVKVSQERIWLPVTPSGEPDFQYMESYMKQIMFNMDSELNNIKQVV